MTESERRQAILFEDAIGAIVDRYICDGMAPDEIARSLRYEADSIHARAAELMTEHRPKGIGT